MSLDSSPSGTPAGASASSPAPSQELQLTPRTKLRKLLSALDDEDDSDKENQPNPSKALSNPVQDVVPPHQTRPLDRDQDEPRPRTKMTAMLQDHSDSSTDDDAGETAYERLKKRLNMDKHAVSRSPSPLQLQRPSPSHFTAADPTSPSPAPRSSQNSALFVSPSKSIARERPTTITWSDSESEPEQRTEGRNRLQELVAKKRAEREARENEAQRPGSDHAASGSESASPPKQQTPKKTTKRATVLVESENSDSDNAAGKKFTSDARPARKASKKAMEEMRRETQRMSRNMQLAHEARTKTKFTTADLFKKMGFRQPKDDSSSEAAHSSDAEGRVRPAGTPPSSPPSLREAGASLAKDAAAAAPEATAVSQSADLAHESDSEADVPSLEDMMRAASSAKAATQQPSIKSKPSVRQYSKQRLTLPHVSDDDLDVVQPRIARALAVLDNIPERQEKESRSLHALRALAHLNEKPGRRRNLPKSMTPAELRQLIQFRAREQVLRELDEKKQRMQEKGEEFMDNDAIEREQLETHELIDKARKEDEELAKREREAAKKAGKNEGDELPSDDEDEDYKGSDEEAEANAVASEDEDEEEQAFSGSEDEIQPSQDDESGDEEAEEDAEPAAAQTGMIDDAAEEDSAEETVAPSDDDQEPLADLMETATPQPRRTHNRRNVVDSDDEADGDAPTTIPSTAPLESNSAADETPAKTPAAAINAAFGFAPAAKSPAFGLSQVFGGTMAGSQSQTQTQGRTGYDSVDISPMIARNNVPAPESATTSPALPSWTQLAGSAVEETPSKVRSTQGLGLASPGDILGETQLSQMPAPTQDAGFEALNSPIRPGPGGETQPTHSTVDTVLLPEDTESPLPSRQAPRRIQRGVARTEVVSSQDDQAAPPESDEIGSGNAFLVMKKASKAAPPTFAKNDSKARAMVDEHAEESDDEYAGLGGASDDDDASTGSLDAETRRMIDDAGDEAVNERRVARAYNAQRLAEDEKTTNKLFKDVTTGAWRRKRGAQDEFFDEDDDEEEAAARRRAAKQREFARMRKALLADERVGKIAQNPKREAFLKAMEDFVPEHELDFLDAADTSQPPPIPATQSQSQPESLPQQQPDASRKRPLETTAADTANERDPRRRRTTGTTKPAIPDIRRVLSDMLGESPTETDAVDGDEDEDEDALNENPDATDDDADHRWTTPNPRRTGPTTTRAAVIDRMALKRGSSSTGSNGTSGTDRLAFSTTRNGSGIKVPSLLRRATTNASVSDTGVTAGIGGSASASMNMGGGDVKMGGSKKSSVNYYVRESERRAKVNEMERVRREGNQRLGRMRREGGALGSLGGGRFE